MGFSRFWLTMVDKEIKVHRRVIRTIFPMIQRVKNDRSVRRALPVYNNDQPHPANLTILEGKNHNQDVHEVAQREIEMVNLPW